MSKKSKVFGSHHCIGNNHIFQMDDDGVVNDSLCRCGLFRFIGGEYILNKTISVRVARPEKRQEQKNE